MACFCLFVVYYVLEHTEHRRSAHQMAGALSEVPAAQKHALAPLCYIWIDRQSFSHLPDASASNFQDPFKRSTGAVVCNTG